jgi:hypothetical protein
MRGLPPRTLGFKGEDLSCDIAHAASRDGVLLSMQSGYLPLCSQTLSRRGRTLGELEERPEGVLAWGDPRRHSPVLAVPGPLEIAAQAARDRALGRRGGLDDAVLEREEPGVRLRLEPGSRPALPNQVTDLVKGDEVGDLAADRRDRDLEPSPAPADRPSARRGAGQLDVVLPAEVLDMSFHQLHASAPARVLLLPEHARQGSPSRG